MWKGSKEGGGRLGQGGERSKGARVKGEGRVGRGSKEEGRGGGGGAKGDGKAWVVVKRMRKGGRMKGGGESKTMRNLKVLRQQEMFAHLLPVFRFRAYLEAPSSFMETYKEIKSSVFCLLYAH